MEANVYVLMEARNEARDLFAVWGTFDEAMDHYERIKGYRPVDVTSETVTDPVTGLQTTAWTFDRDAGGWAWIAQYRVPVTEVFG